MRNKIPFLVMGLLLVLIVVVQLLTPKPLDWRPSFSQYKTTPLGNSILYNELDELFPIADIEVVDETMYNVLQDSTYVNTNYIIITNFLDISAVEQELLFDFIERGNHVFIAAEYFNIDSLGFLPEPNAFNIYTEPMYYFNEDDSAKIVLEQTAKKTEIYSSPRFTRGEIACNAESYKLLGYKEDSIINYVRLEHGMGSLLVNANPTIFSNYGMLDTDLRAYATHALSLLPDGNVLWDERYKIDYLERTNTSKLRFISSNAALKTMFWLVIASAFLFLFFRGKREQRIVPIQQPPKNLSLSFVQTIGELYFERSDHTDLCKKQILYFKDYLARTFRIRKLEQSKESIDHFLHKTQVDEALGRKLLNKIFIAEKNAVVSQTFLMELSTLIEQFKQDVN